MVQRVVSVPFSSMRSVISPPLRVTLGRESTGDAALSGALPRSLPAPRFTPMPEQDLSVWTASLLFESMGRTMRELLMPRQLRVVRIRKRDRA